MIGNIIGASLIWNIIGAVFICIITVGCSRPGYVENILSPVWIYNEWNLNYFGAGLVCILFNLLCPMWTISVWAFMLLKFICTAGRR